MRWRDKSINMFIRLSRYRIESFQSNIPVVIFAREKLKSNVDS